MTARPRAAMAVLALSFAAASPARGQAPEDSQPPPASMPTTGADEAVRARTERSQMMGRLEALEKRDAAKQDRITKLQADKTALNDRVDELELRQIEEAKEQAAAQSDRKLELYGWAHYNFRKIFLAERSQLKGLINDNAIFQVGSLNLFVDGRPHDKWRVLIETRYTFSPDGQIVDRGVAGLLPFERTSTRAINLGVGADEFSWGGIVIERAWVEWAPRDYFKVLFGQFLTPYGIWNLDHGSPVLIGSTPPIMIALESFPAIQTGVKLHGILFFAKERLEYSLTVSNGRVPISNTDLDSNKAIGGRLALTSPRVGELKLGFSWYFGRYTDTEENIDPSVGISPPIVPKVNTTATVRFDEVAFGADAAFAHKGLELQSEVVYSIIKYEDPYRPSSPPSTIANFLIGPSTLPMADHALLSVYGQVAYKLPWLELRPFVRLEWVDANDNIRSDAGMLVIAGLNYRPAPRIVLKAEYYSIWAPIDPDFGPDASSYSKNAKRGMQSFSTQIAVSF